MKIAKVLAVGIFFLSVFVGHGRANADDIHVVSSGGFAAAYRVLGPEFERSTGHRLVSGWGPSMGETPQAIPNRLQRGETVDVVIMVGDSLQGLIKQGKVLEEGSALLALSKIGMVVKSGAPRPDIRTVDALKSTLLAAKSIAYSDSASGVYLSTKLFPRLGLAEALKDKARMIPATPVGEIVAHGEAEIGFQQISELLATKGVDLVGPLPDDAQQVTAFSAGIVAGTKVKSASLALIQFLSSPANAERVRATGLEPAAK